MCWRGQRLLIFVVADDRLLDRCCDFPTAGGKHVLEAKRAIHAAGADGAQEDVFSRRLGGLERLGPILKILWLIIRPFRGAVI